MGGILKLIEPFEKDGEYWGYQVRVASNIQAIFNECPYNDGYDLKINCTKAGKYLENTEFQKDFKHALVFFQGLESLEGLI